MILAVVSGLLIGASFVFKKKGLLRAQAGGPAGEGVGYLKSPLWWLGMISKFFLVLGILELCVDVIWFGRLVMILGEVCNFAGESMEKQGCALGC